MARPRIDVRLAVVALLLLVRPASANIGLPMLAAVWPVSWLLLGPIAAIEAALARRLLELETRRAWRVSIAANAVSTFVGLPLTWVLLVVIEMLTTGGRALGLDTPLALFQSVVLQAPWLIPYPEEVLPWMQLAAALVLCVPFCFMSVFVERFVVLRMQPDAPPAAVRRWSWRANLWTYGGIVAGLLVLLGFALFQ